MKKKIGVHFLVLNFPVSASLRFRQENLGQENVLNLPVASSFLPFFPIRNRRVDFPSQSGTLHDEHVRNEAASGVAGLLPVRFAAGHFDRAESRLRLQAEAGLGSARWKLYLRRRGARAWAAGHFDETAGQHDRGGMVFEIWSADVVRFWHRDVRPRWRGGCRTNRDAAPKGTLSAIGLRR